MQTIFYLAEEQNETKQESAPEQFVVTFLDCKGSTVKVEWVPYGGNATAPEGYGSYSGYTNVSAHMDLYPTSCEAKDSGYTVVNTADKN